MDNRKHFVQIGSTTSSTLSLRHGVPQGSILGPVLFLIYINDIFGLPLHGQLQLYADDAALIYGTNSNAESTQQMQDDLEKLVNWFSKNKLSINIGKTNFIIFSYNPVINPQQLIVTFNQSQICQVDTVKYLGLQINASLNWSNHIDTIKNKIAPFIATFKRIGKFLHRDIALKLYYSYIHSHFLNMICIWGAACGYRLKELQVCQNKALKALFHLPKLTPSKKLYGPKILPIKQLVEYENMLLVYKIKNKLIRYNILLTPNSTISNRITRSMLNYRLPQYKYEYHLKSFFYRGIRSFNNLSEDTKNINKISTFKIELQKQLFDQYLYEYNLSH